MSTIAVKSASASIVPSAFRMYILSFFALPCSAMLSANISFCRHLVQKLICLRIDEERKAHSAAKVTVTI